MKPIELAIPNQSLPQLLMRRASLGGLPPVITPAGYELRTYRPGDEAGWCDIMNTGILAGASTPWTVALCREKLVEKPQFDPRSLFFVTHEGRPVASACAWREAPNETRVGYVHMVCALPEHRGHNLGYVVTLAVLRRFAELGFASAILTTDDFRLAAIRTYLNLGFEPANDHPSHAERWVRVLAQIAERYPTAPKPAARPIVIGPVGRVHNAIAEPIHSGWGEVESEIEVEPSLADALDGLEEFSHVVVLFWIDRVSEDARGTRKLHPRDRADLPLVGVFATHSQHRLNPIGLTVARIVGRRENRLIVRGLDAIDGTPVLDLKGWSQNECPPDVVVPDWVGMTSRT